MAYLKGAGAGLMHWRGSGCVRPPPSHHIKKLQRWSGKFLERDTATRVAGDHVVFLAMLFSCPLVREAGTRLPKPDTQQTTCTHCLSLWAHLGGRDAPALSLQCLQAKLETRHTFIDFNYFMLKPEVGTHPRKGLNGLPIAKSFLFLVVFPNPHLLQTGKCSRHWQALWCWDGESPRKRPCRRPASSHQTWVTLGKVGESSLCHQMLKARPGLVFCTAWEQPRSWARWEDLDSLPLGTRCVVVRWEGVRAGLRFARSSQLSTSDVGHEIGYKVECA